MLNYLGTQNESGSSEFQDRVAEDHAAILAAFGPKTPVYVHQEYPMAVYKEVNGQEHKFTVYSKAEEDALLAEPHAE